MTDFINKITNITNSLFNDYLPTLTSFWVSNPLCAFIGACLVFMMISTLFRKVRNRVTL